jgi:hypothetical protein
MTKPSIRSLLVMVSLGAAVLSGCTRFDGSSAHQSTRQGSLENHSEETNVNKPSGVLDQELTASATVEGFASTEHSMEIKTDDVELIFAELDQALVELETILGSSETWSLNVP